MTSRQLAGYHVIRLAVASVFLVHALARIGLGIVDDFAGYWMATFGVSRSVGLVASWTVTGFELIGGLAIALDRWVLPFAIWFGADGGRNPHHPREGGLVRGGGRAERDGVQRPDPRGSRDGRPAPAEAALAQHR
jgi:hypothetical protein